MNDHQIKRESSDTFGRNTQADLELLRRINERAELLRRINERAENNTEEMFALLVVAAAIACVCGIAGVIGYTIFF
jgi:hypothetical protein